ncbi:hypothetical protein Tco_0842897 [Tanacetum coccineum]|uniref:Uncharacterized protein n=1 Tax=Tanacetum coccineum TaxID=301880 RepID=A0ABQ5B0J2_9ASTR
MAMNLVTQWILHGGEVPRLHLQMRNMLVWSKIHSIVHLAVKLWVIDFKLVRLKRQKSAGDIPSTEADILPLDRLLCSSPWMRSHNLPTMAFGFNKIPINCGKQRSAIVLCLTTMFKHPDPAYKTSGFTSSSRAVEKRCDRTLLCQVRKYQLRTSSLKLLA